MNTLNIIQSTVGTEEVNVSIISALYNAAKNTANCTLQGRLHSTAAYEDQMQYLISTYPSLHIDATNVYIKFKDSEFERICSTNWGDGIGVTKSQLAEVTDWGSAFKDTTIQDFSELKYFTGVTNINTNGVNGFFPDTMKVIDFANITTMAFPFISNSGGTNSSLLETVRNFHVENIGNSSGGYQFFTNLTNLKNIYLGSTKTFGAATFKGCVNLQNIGSLHSVTSITNNIFENTAITIPAECPNLTSVSFNAFRNSHFTGYYDLGTITTIPSAGTWGCCFGLGAKYIILPSTLQSIGVMVCQDIDALDFVKCLATTPPTQLAQDSVSGSFPFAKNDGVRSKGSFPIYVPDGTISAYEAASGWSVYAGRFKELSDFDTDFPNYDYGFPSYYPNLGPEL